MIRIAQTAFVLALFVASPVFGYGLSGVLHDPPRNAQAGKSVSIEVALEGIGKDQPDVVVYYRTQGGSSYSARPLTYLGVGRYHTDIPGTDVRGLGLMYYVEIRHPKGIYHSRIGSEKRPISVSLLDPDARRESDWVPKLAAVVVAVALVGGAALVQARRQRNRLLDQRFWAYRLGPMARLGDEAARQKAERLAGVTLDHPVDGLRRFTREEILAKLSEVRGRRPEELKRAVGTLPEDAGATPGFKSLSAQAIDNRIGPLAADVGRLCSAAWLLSDTPSADPTSVTSFLEPFENARRDARNLQQAMARKQLERAGLLLEKLSRSCRNLRRSIAEVDSGRSVEELSRRLDDPASIPADTLGSVLEYYALLAPRGSETRKKFLVVAEAIARHDGLVDGAPARVRDAMRRRRLLRNEISENEPSEKTRHQARELRARLAMIKESPETDLSAIRADVDRFVEVLGASVYTINGLSEAVALALAFRQKSAAIDRCKAGTFDSVISDLATVAREHSDGDPEKQLVGEDADPAAIELLRRAEEELRECVEAGDHEQRGYYLDPTELDAAANTDPEHTAWASLVARSAACRTAAHRFAQQYARSQQPAGREPQPVPLATAETLLERCRQLTRDLQDAVQRDLMRGNTGRAKDTTRVLHRFSRTSTGLALLAQLPVDEWREETGEAR